MKILLIGLTLAGMLLTGCEKREKGEPQREPGSFFPTYGCVTRPDGTLNCSDVR